jgi:hypothetical protein
MYESVPYVEISSWALYLSALLNVEMNSLRTEWMERFCLSAYMTWCWGDD